LRKFQVFCGKPALVNQWIVRSFIWVKRSISSGGRQVTVSFKVNGGPVSVNAPQGTPLLWVIRDQLKLTGVKFGCGVGLGGA
jgi:hypothetical protein